MDSNNGHDTLVLTILFGNNLGIICLCKVSVNTNGGTVEANPKERR